MSILCKNARTVLLTVPPEKFLVSQGEIEKKCDKPSSQCCPILGRAQRWAFGWVWAGEQLMASEKEKSSAQDSEMSKLDSDESID